MNQDEIFTIRKELRGLKAVETVVRICDDESISSRKTTYDALTPEKFNIENGLHRLIIRRTVIFLQSLGSLRDWDIEEMLPEALPLVAEAA